MIIASYPWWAWIALGCGIGMIATLIASLFIGAKESDEQEKQDYEDLVRGRPFRPKRFQRR